MADKVLGFSKANGFEKEKPVQNVILEFKGDLPELSSEDMPKFYNAQAKGIEDALCAVLPGAVYERVLLKMLERKVSGLTVSYGDLENG